MARGRPDNNGAWRGETGHTAAVAVIAGHAAATVRMDRAAVKPTAGHTMAAAKASLAAGAGSRVGEGHWAMRWPARGMSEGQDWAGSWASSPLLSLLVSPVAVEYSNITKRVTVPIRKVTLEWES